MRDYSRACTEEAMLQHGVATLPSGNIIELGLLADIDGS
jgi:hypothetical protein